MLVLRLLGTWQCGEAHGGLASIIETEEEEFCVFVREAEIGEQVPDCIDMLMSAIAIAVVVGMLGRGVHQSTIHMMSVQSEGCEIFCIGA